jgi:hypothetical protein
MIQAACPANFPVQQRKQYERPQPKLPQHV